MSTATRVAEIRKWVTVSQASRRLAVADVTVRRWIRGGRLRGAVVGGLLVVRAADVEALAGRREREAEPGAD